MQQKRVEIKMRDYMDRQVTPPKQVTWSSPTWGPPPLYKQALSHTYRAHIISVSDTITIIPENSQEFYLEWPCQIEIHIIVETS